MMGHVIFLSTELRVFDFVLPLSPSPVEDKYPQAHTYAHAHAHVYPLHSHPSSPPPSNASGGGEVDLKLGMSAAEFVKAYEQQPVMVVDCTYDDDAQEGTAADADVA